MYVLVIEAGILWMSYILIFYIKKRTTSRSSYRYHLIIIYLDISTWRWSIMLCSTAVLDRICMLEDNFPRYWNFHRTATRKFQNNAKCTSDVYKRTQRSLAFMRIEISQTPLFFIQHTFLYTITIHGEWNS